MASLPECDYNSTLTALELRPHTTVANEVGEQFTDEV